MRDFLQHKCNIFYDFPQKVLFLVFDIITFKTVLLWSNLLGFLPQASHSSLLEFWSIPFDRPGELSQVCRTSCSYTF